MIVLKIGGQVINESEALAEALDYFSTLREPGVLVHGGGRRASELLRQVGREPKMVDGRRLTDGPTLEIVTMVYAGLINKNIVAGLQARGVNAIGLSGADGNLIRAEKRMVGTVDYGFAGDVETVDGRLLKTLLDSGFRPVACPITHDGRGQLLNTNADTIATEVATALTGLYDRVELQYCFEFAGVLRSVDDPASVIGRMDPTDYAAYREDGTVGGGMLPKLDNAFGAIANGVAEVRIGHIGALARGAGTRLMPC